MLNMNFNEFETKCKEICGDDLKVSWATGGMTGGNCWNDNGPYPYYSDETEPKDTCLEKIIKCVLPDISGLQVFKLLNNDNLYTYDSYTENEYYGNNTRYSTRTLDLYLLYALLNE